MARIRTIKPEFPHSESMGKVSREARLCFVLLWTLADDEGRLRGNSRMLASLLYPYDDDASKRIETWLSDLESQDCIIRYQVAGQNYLQVCNWLNHQKIDRPTKSKFPSFDEYSRILATNLESSYVDLGPKDQGVDQGRDHLASSDESLLAVEVDRIPIQGGEFVVREDFVKTLSDAYPIVDVPQTIREIKAWLFANPAKAKTARGAPRFINSWCERIQNRG